MTAAWPGTLPQFKLTGIADQRQAAKLRSSVDVGPAIVRRRFTAAVRNVSVPMIFTNDQRIAFEDFYINDLGEGVSRFTWTDPLSGSTVLFRFREEAGPAWTSTDGGEVGKWTVTLNLEILP